MTTLLPSRGQSVPGGPRPRRPGDRALRVLPRRRHLGARVPAVADPGESVDCWSSLWLTLSDCSSVCLWPIQVLTGDFNAEPHEPAVQYLLDPANYAAVKCTAVDDQSVGRTGSSSSISPAAFVDSWSEHSQRSDTTASPVGAEMEIDATGSIVSADASLSSTAGGDPGFTFPSCNPVKRIDFVLVRNATAPADGGSGRRGPTATIANSYIVGTRPTKDTGVLRYLDLLITLFWLRAV